MDMPDTISPVGPSLPWSPIRGPRQAFKLSITYLVPPGAELDGRILLWGPGPLPEFAGCMAAVATGH